MPTVTPTYQRANILTGQAQMYLAPYIVASPPALPADTVELGGAWPAAWAAVGATLNGLSFKFARTVNDIKIEEQSVPVDKRTTETKFTMDTELSEDTLQAMLYAYGGGVISTTAATSVLPAMQVLAIASELTQFSFGFEAVNEFGFFRRVLVPIVVSVANASTEFKRADKQRTYAVSFESLIDVAQVVIRNKTAPHT